MGATTSSEGRGGGHSGEPAAVSVAVGFPLFLDFAKPYFSPEVRENAFDVFPIGIQTVLLDSRNKKIAALGRDLARGRGRHRDDDVHAVPPPPSWRVEAMKLQGKGRLGTGVAGAAVGERGGEGS